MLSGGQRRNAGRKWNLCVSRRAHPAGRQTSAGTDGGSPGGLGSLCAVCHSNGGRGISAPQRRYGSGFRGCPPGGGGQRRQNSGHGLRGDTGHHDPAPPGSGTAIGQQRERPGRSLLAFALNPESPSVCRSRRGWARQP